MKSKPNILPCWCSALLKLISKSEIRLWRRLCLSGISECLWGLTYIRQRVKEGSGSSGPGCGPCKTTCVSVCVWDGGGGVLLGTSQSGCSALTHVHISYLQLSNKSCMLIQAAGQPQEMNVCALTNDVSISPSNAIQFFSTELIWFTPFQFSARPHILSSLGKREQRVKQRVPSYSVMKDTLGVNYDLWWWWVLHVLTWTHDATGCRWDFGLSWLAETLMRTYNLKNISGAAQSLLELM